MKVSARNNLAGIVSKIQEGAIKELQLVVGSKAFAFVKASNVIIGVE